jgi:hypothetical protein
LCCGGRRSVVRNPGSREGPSAPLGPAHNILSQPGRQGMSLFAHLRRLRRRLVSTLTGHRGSRLWTSQLGDSGFNEKPRRWRRGPGQVGGRRPIRLAPWRKEPEIARQTSGRMKTKWQNSKGRYRQSRDVEDEPGERCSQAVWLSQNHGEGVSRWRSQFGFVPTPLAARGNPARLPERR